MYLYSVSAAEFKAKYEEKELLGEGGYALVFAGFHRNDNLPVRLLTCTHTANTRTHRHTHTNTFIIHPLILYLVKAKCSES